MSYPTFSFGCICGPKFQNLCLYVTSYLQIGTHLNHSLFSTRSALGFQTFHSELTVVWAKRSVVANKIESKSYYSQNLCLYVTSYLQIGTHLNHSLFSTRSARGFQTFHSELTVVWAKRSVVANKIEWKSYYSPLILHSVGVLQKKKILNTQKQAFR